MFPLEELRLERALIEAIRGACPDAAMETVQAAAERLLSEYSTAKEVAFFMRSEDTAERDAQALMKAVEQISKAADQLRGLGQHGARAIKQVSETAAGRKSGIAPLLSLPEVGPTLADSLAELAAELQAAAERMPKDNPGILTSLVANVLDYAEPIEPPGNRRNMVAHYVAKEASEQFFYLTGRQPTEIYDAYLGQQVKEEGTYLHFLQTVFDALDIQARATSFVKKAHRYER